jgi:hypothetical protein
MKNFESILERIKIFIPAMSISSDTGASKKRGKITMNHIESLLGRINIYCGKEQHGINAK